MNSTPLQGVVITIALSLMSVVSSAKFISSPDGDFECLIEAIYFEARNQSIAGQIAVANVIINRTYHLSHPDNICSVVHEYKQFSYYSDGKPEYVDDLRSWQEAAQIASFVMFTQDFDITEGSTMYHADYVNPIWDFTKLNKVVTIDNHIFYQEE